jgi:hypothetical protein
MTTRPLSLKKVQQIAIPILLGWTALNFVLFHYVLHLELRNSAIDAVITNILPASSSVISSAIINPKSRPPFMCCLSLY